MVVVQTDVGTKYRQPVLPNTPVYARSGVRMEDAHAVYAATTRRRSRRQSRDIVVCVADGHGSIKHAPGVFLGGRECADAACEHAIRYLKARNVFGGGGRATWNAIQMFDECQAAVKDTLCRYSHEWDEEGVMRVHTSNGSHIPLCGTTLSVAVIRPERASSFSWVGDSVGVIVRGDELILLGTPHSVHREEECKRMRLAGAKVDGKYFRYGVGKSSFSIAIGRSLGHFGHPGLTHTPQTMALTILPGDRMVIATDGLWEVCTPEQVARILANATSESNACDALMREAKSTKQERDNVTIACVFVESSATRRRRVQKAFGGSFSRLWRTLLMV